MSFLARNNTTAIYLIPNPKEFVQQTTLFFVFLMFWHGFCKKLYVKILGKEAFNHLSSHRRTKRNDF